MKKTFNDYSRQLEAIVKTEYKDFYLLHDYGYNKVDEVARERVILLVMEFLIKNNVSFSYNDIITLVDGPFKSR